MVSEQTNDLAKTEDSLTKDDVANNLPKTGLTKVRITKEEAVRMICEARKSWGIRRARQSWKS
jgi:hypothetical protein